MKPVVVKLPEVSTKPAPPTPPTRDPRAMDGITVVVARRPEQAHEYVIGDIPDPDAPPPRPRGVFKPEVRQRFGGRHHAEKFRLERVAKAAPHYAAAVEAGDVERAELLSILMRGDDLRDTHPELHPVFDVDAWLAALAEDA